MNIIVSWIFKVQINLKIKIRHPSFIGVGLDLLSYCMFHEDAGVESLLLLWKVGIKFLNSFDFYEIRS